MRKIINHPDDFVDETIDGILLAFPHRLRAASADRRAMVRADAPRQGKVGIVTGGGSGHLPAFIGYVGVGLCDGVAIGNVFSSPSAAQVHAATRAVSGGAGVLYLYGNYGGDIYNFDLAADLAAIDGIPVRTVLAADDVASAPAESAASRRGVAGMVFGFKIAGASAERGDPLDEVARIAQKTADRTRTMGVGLSPTILPAAGEPTFLLADGEMEVGIGIHGEPGVLRGTLEPADAIAARLVTRILDDVDAPAGSSVAVLVNGAGATPLEELFVLYRRAHAIIESRGLTVRTALVGDYVTSLEMAGASVSVLLLDDELSELLDEPARSPFFQTGFDEIRMPAPAEAAALQADADEDRSDGEPTVLASLLTSVFERLPSHADELRELDAALGDGDLGITVSSGATAATAAIARDPAAPDAVLLQRVGAAFAAANPSTFAALIGGGVLYAASRLDPSERLAAPALTSFARAVAERIAERGRAQLGDKTVLDALVPSIDALDPAQPGTAADTVDAMIATVERVIAETTPMQSARGRAAWLQERSAGRQDPGMTAYLAFLTELRASL